MEYILPDKVIVCWLSKPNKTAPEAQWIGNDFRIMSPNEHYYKQYDTSQGDIAVDYDQEDTPFEYS